MVCFGLSDIEATAKLNCHFKPQWYGFDVVIRKHLVITSDGLFDRAVDVMQIRHERTVHLYPRSTSQNHESTLVNPCMLPAPLQYVLAMLINRHRRDKCLFARTAQTNEQAMSVLNVLIRMLPNSGFEPQYLKK